MNARISVLFAGAEAVDCNVEAKNNEARIKKAVFCNYDKSARPTLTDGAIKLKFRMIVKGFNFDSISNKMTVSTWLAMVNRLTDVHAISKLSFMYQIIRCSVRRLGPTTI